MSTLSQFSGGTRVPKMLVNRASSGGVTDAGVLLGLANTAGIKVVTSGALTAATLVTVLSLTGQGAVGILACAGVDNTTRAHRMKVTVDGVVVFDATTDSSSSWYAGIVVTGGLFLNGSAYNSILAVPDYIPFNSSFLVEYASSLTETAKTNFGYIYRTY